MTDKRIKVGTIYRDTDDDYCKITGIVDGNIYFKWYDSMNDLHDNIKAHEEYMLVDDFDTYCIEIISIPKKSWKERLQ